MKHLALALLVLWGFSTVSATTIHVPSDLPTIQAASIEATEHGVAQQAMFSTFLGGSSFERFEAVALDSAGNIWAVGSTFSANIGLKNPLDSTFGGNGDVFVCRLSPDGQSLQYTTYLGGSGEDIATGIAIRPDGRVVICGLTTSYDFPLVHPIDATIDSSFGSGSDADAFVLALSPNGDSLLFSTYYGGGANDEAHGVAVDSEGGIYVTGWTKSPDFRTKHAYDSALAGTEAFVIKIAPSFDSLEYSTFLGGISPQGGYAVAVDRNKRAYISGSPNAFVATLSQGGDTLLFSSAIGGPSDAASAICVDTFGAIYFAGWSSYSHFPMKNAVQSVFRGYRDAFVAKYAPDKSLEYSTYLGGAGSGGSADNTAYGLAIDKSGCAYVGGYSAALDFPTVNAFQGVIGGSADAWGCKLTPDGRNLIFSTFLGGTGFDEAHAVCVSPSGEFVVVGRAGSGNFPTVSAISPTYAGGNDGFIAKLAPKLSCCTGTTGNVNMTGSVDLADLSALVAYLTVGSYWLPCVVEADVNAGGTVDLADLSSLVSYLTGGGYVLPSCP